MSQPPQQRTPVQEQEQFSSQPQYSQPQKVSGVTQEFPPTPQSTPAESRSIPVVTEPRPGGLASTSAPTGGSSVLTSAGTEGHKGVFAGGEGSTPTADVHIPSLVMSDQPISHSMKERMSSLFQSYKPINQIHEHLSSIHCYHGEPLRQVQAHHYCSHLNEDLRQCVIYDGPGADAKLIGVEYVISSKLFQQLPVEEKAYWHPHMYEVKAGLISLVGVPEAIEDGEMQKLINTYGKTWHFWQVDRGDVVPSGPAKLMSTFHMDGEVDDRLVELRDKELGMSTHGKRQRRIHFQHDLIDRDAKA